MAETLTKEQAEAVKDRSAKLLVSAAAGSGKTKVLVDRLLACLTNPADAANLDEFLIITYTKAAASELRGKIAAKLSERIAQEPENRHLQEQLQRLYLTKISTVHGFCADILRDYAYRLDIGADFRVADENECRELQETLLQDILDRAYEEQGENPDFCAFVDTQGLGRDDNQIPELIIKVFNSARCHADPQQWLDKCVNSVSLKNITDAAQTDWGEELLKQLHKELQAQIAIFDCLIAQAGTGSNMKNVVENLQTTKKDYEALLKCETWDAVAGFPGINYGRLTFPRKGIEAIPVEQIKAARGAAKDKIADLLLNFTDSTNCTCADIQQIASAQRGLISLVRTFDSAYSRLKRSRRILDFGDLEHETLNLLLGKSRTAPTEAAREIGSRFREIMVDEYQDSNGVQDAIFSALTQDNATRCFMVGDVKQSIYQFRLADPSIFLKKYDTYGEDPDIDGCRKIMLSHNFRSGGEVIESVNNVFNACMSKEVGDVVYDDAAALREGIPHNPLPDSAVELHVLDTTEDSGEAEADFTARRIRQLLDDGTLIRSGDAMRPIRQEDIVILLRSPGSQSADYQRALAQYGLQINTGGGRDLLKTQEVSTARCLLETIENPRQDIPLLSTLASPLFGFTADELAEVRSGRRKLSMYDALLQSDAPKVREFLTVLGQLRQSCRIQTLTELVQQCFLQTRMDSVYGAMEDGEVKKDNLRQFFQLVSDFEKDSLRSLPQFLEHLKAMESKGLLAASTASSGVTIMSIHKSKGLEFPVVFLCGLAHKFNPESMRAQVLCHRDLGLGLNIADTNRRIRYPSMPRRAIIERMRRESISEEMRVLYVAMTRARDRLIMTYAAKNPEKLLQNMALRLPFDGGKMLCREATCHGHWILLAALQHTEAGQLRAAVEARIDTHLPKYPWLITLQKTETAREEVQEQVSEVHAPEGTEEMIAHSLHYEYPHLAATCMASKQTATGRKGRQKDEEAAENSPEPIRHARTWRRPAFLTEAAGGRDYGSAMHTAMQFICYEKCSDLAAVEQEIQRMACQGLLTSEQAQLVNTAQIAAFFASPLGEKLRNGVSYLREFKFSILDDAACYGENLSGEQVLLQGVVDCAILEEDGITVLDFKTDRVTETTVSKTVEEYRTQVKTYTEALQRIYEMPVKAACLYFFRLNRFCPL